MNKEDLSHFREWFSGFCRSYYLDDVTEQRNISLKEIHTDHVCENILAIAEGELLDGNRTLMAETVALFHDIGRFPQYAEYKTFKDSASVNHGLLGATALSGSNVLERLTEKERDVIITAVKFHNAFSIADIGEEEKILFLKLIRDADKLDIWRVFIEYYESPEKERPEAVSLGLPDSAGCSEKIIARLRNGKTASLSDMVTLNDFKLLQLSWIFDLNFKTTFRLLRERDYINRIAATLPQTDEVLSAVAVLSSYASEKMNNG
jgi:hypothetical protein